MLSTDYEEWMKNRNDFSSLVETVLKDLRSRNEKLSVDCRDCTVSDLGTGMKCVAKLTLGKQTIKAIFTLKPNINELQYILKVTAGKNTDCILKSKDYKQDVQSTILTDDIVNQLKTVIMH